MLASAVTSVKLSPTGRFAVLGSVGPPSHFKPSKSLQHSNPFTTQSFNTEALKNEPLVKAAPSRTRFAVLQAVTIRVDSFPSLSLSVYCVAMVCGITLTCWPSWGLRGCNNRSVPFTISPRKENLDWIDDVLTTEDNGQNGAWPIPPPPPIKTLCVDSRLTSSDLILSCVCRCVVSRRTIPMQ